MEKIKLPEDFKKRWVGALRSGEYKQGQSRLYNKDTNKYCCLGVAAHICGVNLSFIPERGTIPSINLQNKGNLWNVPEELANNTDLQSQLYSMNDGVSEEGTQADSMTFMQIADYIEQNL